jgi:hypothetical protein
MSFAIVLFAYIKQVHAPVESYHLGFSIGIQKRISEQAAEKALSVNFSAGR